MSQARVVEADLTWTGNAFEPDIQIVVDPGGRIADVGALGAVATHRLSRRALFPGFVNAHSHAFQRGLRGRGERFPEGSGSFWTWRDAMYGLVDALDVPGFRSLCRQAFEEMRDAGITSVGEFHYLHHDEPDDFALDEVVLDAAAESGIRIVLLETYYRQGGIGQPLGPGQRRFDGGSLDRFWAQVDALTRAAAPGQSVGVAAHSVRAVTLHELVELHAEARRRALPFHIHVEEQRREIDECLAAYGRSPMAVLNERLEVDRRVTAVHCTHTAVEDMTALLFAGGGVCVCPLTEANLGDGVPHLAPVHETGGRLSVGTDSNARIAMLEEMRWLEYGQRLRGEMRGAMAGDGGRVAPVLLAAATAGGARALGLETGIIAAGNWADFAVIDLEHPSLVACDPDGVLEALVFGGADGAITATCVGGDWRESR